MCQEQTLQYMVKSEYFPDIEDSEMLEDNMSAISGLREAVIEQILPLLILLIGDGSPEERGELRKTLFRKERASPIVFGTGAAPSRWKEN